LTGLWTPIGDDVYPFKGTFDGQGKTISGLSVSGGYYAGFFGYVGANGQIKNLNVVGTEIRSNRPSQRDYSYAGGLVAYYASTKTIENCGAKVGSIGTGSGITYNLYSGGYSGGLVGYIGYTSGTNMTITNSYATGNIENMGDYSGGLVGGASGKKITITNSYATGKVSSKAPGDYGGAYSGGIAATSGGLVGSAGVITITNSYASGNVGAIADVMPMAGGLVGFAGVITITNSYASGYVGTGGRGEYICGLLVGEADTSTITNSYTSAEGDCGGIFGEYTSGTNTSVYCNNWNGLTGIYSNNTRPIAIKGSPKGIVRTTSENLKKQETYINWDFGEVWGIVEGVSYPYLKKLKVTALISGKVEADNVEAEYLTQYQYTGSQIKPEPVIYKKSNGATLTKGTDYTLTYGANKNVGVGTMTISGTELKEKTLSFSIVPKTLTITGASANKVYDGTTTATITGATLSGVIAGDDVSLPTNSATGTFASANAGNNITININTSLTGSSAANYVLQPLTANIEPKNLAANAIQQITSQTFTGSGITPNLVVMDGSKTLVKGTDYTVTFSSNTNVGTATATVTGKGNYTGTATANFTIVAKEINSTTVSSIPNQSYTGSAIKPTIQIKNGSTILTANTDYTLAYYTNVEIGTAWIEVIGKGNYTGSFYTTFEIVSPSSSSSKNASSSSSNKNVSSSSSAVSSTRCKDSQNRELYCNWTSGCYAIDPAFAEPSGQTCTDLVDECQRYGTLFAGSLVEGSGTKCSTTTQSSSSNKNTSSSSSAVSATRCKDFQNRELYCNWTSGCYAIDPTFAETPGQTCTALIEECQKYASLFAGSLVEGSGKMCSGSELPMPIFRSQIAISNIRVKATSNSIVLENLPQDTKVDVYNIQGKLIFTSGISMPADLVKHSIDGRSNAVAGKSLNLGSDNLVIPVQTKGMYIIKIGVNNVMRVPVM